LDQCGCSITNLNLSISIQQFDKKPVEDQREIGGIVTVIKSTMQFNQIEQPQQQSQEDIINLDNASNNQQ